MAMSKADFIALADAIREHNETWKDVDTSQTLGTAALSMLADFCQQQNPAFKRARWLGYIEGTNGKHGQTNVPGVKV